MRKGSVALFGACLALPLIMGAGAAGAAQPEGGRYVYVPPGAMVVFLPLPGATVSQRQTLAEPVGFPVARMIAEQDAMVRHMMADMDSLMASLPDPQQMIRSVMDGMPRAAPGSGVVMTSLSSGNGTCSETITYRSAEWRSAAGACVAHRQCVWRLDVDRTGRRDADRAVTAADAARAGCAAARKAVDGRLSAAPDYDPYAATELIGVRVRTRPDPPRGGRGGLPWHWAP